MKNYKLQIINGSGALRAILIKCPRHGNAALHKFLFHLSFIIYRLSFIIYNLKGYRPLAAGGKKKKPDETGL